MRKILAATVALGPLCLACAAFADQTISNSQNTAVTTSGAAGNITIAPGGSVNVKDGSAVTVNSNASVTNGGSITMNVAGNSTTGLLINAGNTGEISNTGTISLLAGFTRPDSNKDGLQDGPWSTGTDRRGIWLNGAGAFNGNISNSGSIVVEGENSFGIQLNSVLNGNLLSTGGITVTGDNSVGFQSTQTINGIAPASGVAEALHISAVSVSGNGSKGIDIEGDVNGGRALFDGAVSVTGFSTSTRFVGTPFTNADPTDFAQSGPAVTIAGNLSNGALFDAVPSGNITASTDFDGDGNPDTNQRSSSVTVFGSAPAILVGSTTHDITLGAVGTGNATAAADYQFGLILKGTVNASGVFDQRGNLSFPATGVQVGTGTGNVTIVGGIRNAGAITVTAFQAPATGVELMSGATANLIRNDGAISTTVVATAPGEDAVALLINAGAHVNTLTNSGAISATVIGETAASAFGNVTALRDVSGTIGDIENRGVISAGDDSGIPVDEDTRLTAVDAHNNTTGLIIHQFQASATDATPAMTGSIFFGSGNDTLAVNAGTVQGPAIAFGDGTNSLIVNGPVAGGNVTSTTSVIGNISTSGAGTLGVDVAKGYLQQNNSQTVALSSLHVGSQGTMVVTIDPSGATPTGGFTVTGGAVFDDGASVGVRFRHLLQGNATFVLVDTTGGGSLTVNGSINAASLQTNTPYLYTASLDNALLSSGKVAIDVQEKSAALLGMNAAQGAALNPFLAALPADQFVESAFLNQTTKAGFFNLYNQLMPEDAAAPLLSLASGVDAVSRALGDRRPQAEPGETTGWAQEINFYATKKAHDSQGFNSYGFGGAGGFERGTTLGAIGVSLAFTSSNLGAPGTIDNDTSTANLVELGLYWRASTEHMRAWARAAGGYAWFDSMREFTGTTNILKAKSNWNGYTGALAGGISYEAVFGRYFVRPEASLEYFYLRQGAHTEVGGSEACGNTTCDAFDLGFSQSSSQMGTATAMLNFGAKYGEGGWLQPEIHLGYRENFLFDTGDGQAYFMANPSNVFALTSDSLKGGGPIIGFRLLATGPGGFLSLEGETDSLTL